MDLSTKFNAEITPAKVRGAEIQIAELTKIITYFEVKYGPFSDAEPVISGLALPARPLFLIDFMLRLQRLQEYVNFAKNAESSEATARAEQ